MAGSNLEPLKVKQQQGALPLQPSRPEEAQFQGTEPHRIGELEGRFAWASRAIAGLDPQAGRQAAQRHASQGRGLAFSLRPDPLQAPVAVQVRLQEAGSALAGLPLQLQQGFAAWKVSQGETVGAGRGEGV